jgi:hypothetical protein
MGFPFTDGARLLALVEKDTKLRVGILNNAISHASVAAIVGGSGVTDSWVCHRNDKDGNEKTYYELRTESLMNVVLNGHWGGLLLNQRNLKFST